MRARRRRAIYRRPPLLLRLLCALVFALFVGQSALAFAAPCVHVDDASDPCQDERDEHDEGSCPCPLPCASCCAGNALRALPAALPSLDLLLPAFVEIEILDAERAPPSAEPAEILHVPKPDRV